jgi:DMSO reductase anchor subunit
MHPAPSLIAFTVLSGAGYGLLIVLGLIAAFWAGEGTAWPGGAGVALGLLLVSAGLLSSTGHLGHPERAWRAFSQWRSSWLSREGVAACLTYLPVLALGASWVIAEAPSRLLGVLVVICAAATVICTAMIYASLKPIARWHNAWVPPAFMGLSLATGSAWAWLVWAVTSGPSPGLALLAACAALLFWMYRLVSWQAIDRLVSPATAGSATGLGRFGEVRLVEPPHFSENYLLKEMGFRVARKHAAKLRLIAVACGGGVPLLAGVVAALLPWPAAGLLLSLMAVVGAMTGTLIERWLFFAEATHTLTLFYGAEAA